MSEVIVPQTVPIPRLLLLFAARAGREQALADSLPGLAKGIAEASRHPTRAMGLVRQRPDPFAEGVGENRGFDSGLDLRLESGGELSSLITAAVGIGRAVQEHAHVDLSYALAGPLHVLIPDSDATIRYVYLMRRRADWSDAEYLRHYSENHVKFGFRTSGIAGYSTHRLDADASRSAAAATGLGSWSVSSVSELYIPDLEIFFRDAMGSEVGDEAIADEERFVDRANSVACAMDVIFDAA